MSNIDTYNYTDNLTIPIYTIITCLDKTIITVNGDSLILNNTDILLYESDAKVRYGTNGRVLKISSIFPTPSIEKENKPLLYNIAISKYFDFTTNNFRGKYITHDINSVPYNASLLHEWSTNIYIKPFLSITPSKTIQNIIITFLILLIILCVRNIIN